METRVDLAGVAAEPYQTVMQLETYVRGRLDRRLLDLVKVRASMVNGCAFCIDMHTTESLRHGDDPRRVVALAAWREAPFFDRDERAALALTDAVTRLGEDGVPDEVWDAAVVSFGTEGAVDLLFAIATINVWNRLALTTRLQPPTLVPVGAAGTA